MLTAVQLEHTLVAHYAKPATFHYVSNAMDQTTAPNVQLKATHSSIIGSAILTVQVGHIMTLILVCAAIVQPLVKIAPVILIAPLAIQITIIIKVHA